VTTPTRARLQITLLAWGAIAGQLVFVGGWLVLDRIERHGFSPAHDDISDLGALTATHPTAARITLLVSGLLTVAFALLALRPSLRSADLGEPAGPWLIALSLVCLDNVSDFFFRLDCRAADTGCSMSQATSSWHGKIHVAAFAIAFIPTLIAPFVLSRRMRVVDGWRDLARPTRWFGFAFVAAAIITGAAQGSAVQGTTQRFMAAMASAGIVALAWRVQSLANRPDVISGPSALAATSSTN
jgi:uncharacterized protein DUF998